MMRTLMAALVVTLAGCSAPQPTPASAPEPAAAAPARIDPDLAQAGLSLAQARCAACHAVSGPGPSPMAAAPAFQDIGARYDFEVLREELIAGVHVGPGEMPTFELTLDEADALLAYLQSAQAEAP